MTAPLRLITANLLNGGADPRAFAEQVRALQADVVAVQELAPEQASELARVLPHGKLEPSRDFLGMGLALRHRAAVERLRLPGRDARVAQLEPRDWPDLAGPLEILNVHVFSPTHRPMRRALPLRREQLRGLEAYLDASPVAARVLLGDLNATPLWPVYRHLAARLDDAARRAATRLGRRPRATWGPGVRAPRLLRIDHVLTHGVEVERVEVLPLEGSDHSAVYAELRLGAASAG